jgi:hypothetical protein
MVATDWSRTVSVDARSDRLLHPYPLAERLRF